MKKVQDKCNYGKKFFQHVVDEKIIMFFLLGITFVVLFIPAISCAMQPLDIKFVLNEKLEPGYFVKIEETAENQWTIKSISNEKIKREQPREEILYLNLNNMHVQPYYAHYIYYGLHGDFACTSVIQKAMGERELSEGYYSPCNSALTRISASVNSILSTAVSLGTGAGCSRTLDKGKIEKICVQTNLIAKVKECSEFMKKIIIEPRIVDESGLHSDTDFVEIEKKQCLVESGNFICPIKISSRNDNLSVIYEPESYKLKYDTKGYSLKPVVKIVSKKFDAIYPKSIFDDQSLAIKLNKITLLRDTNNANNDRIAFDIDIQNMSEKYVSIESVSFYINESILTPTISKTELLPKSYKNDIHLSLTQFPDVGAFKNAWKSIRTDVTKYNADKVFITLGISSKYKIDNADKSLFKSKQNNFSGLLNIDTTTNEMNVGVTTNQVTKNNNQISKKGKVKQKK